MTNAKLTAAIEAARRKVGGDAAWSRSVEKAASALTSGQLIVTVLRNGGLVSSERGTYRITNGHCSCPAALNGCAHCYHVSALRSVDIDTSKSPEVINSQSDKTYGQAAPSTRGQRRQKRGKSTPKSTGKRAQNGSPRRPGNRRRVHLSLTGSRQPTR
jgi:hypothetical protein